MQTLTYCDKAVFSPEFMAEAASEAIALRSSDLQGFLKKKDIKCWEETPEAKNRAPHFNLFVSTERQSIIASVAPNLFKVIWSTANYRAPTGRNVVQNYFPTSIALNFCGPSQQLSWHTDAKLQTPSISTTTTLQGLGVFMVKDVYGHGIIEDVHAETGDIHYLLNLPGDYRLHTGATGGAQERVTVSFSKPVILK